jgi:hypothetical protein
MRSDFLLAFFMVKFLQLPPTQDRKNTVLGSSITTLEVKIIVKHCAFVSGMHHKNVQLEGGGGEGGERKRP